MLYPANIESKTDFSFIRQQLRQYCSFSIARELVDEMTFLTDPEAITLLLAQAREMLDLLADASFAYPQCEMHDMRDSLSRIRIEGLFLDEEELSRLRHALDAVVQYLDFFHSLPALRFPLLADWAPMPPDEMEETPNTALVFRDVLRDIDRILDKYGQLRDNASPELARIRRELRLSQGSVNRALQQILRQA